jgi:hypothetical protein
MGGWVESLAVWPQDRVAADRKKTHNPSDFRAAQPAPIPPKNPPAKSDFRGASVDVWTLFRACWAAAFPRARRLSEAIGRCSDTKWDLESAAAAFPIAW